MATQQQLTTFLEQVTRDWPRQPVYPGQIYRARPLYAPYQIPVAHRTTPHELARHLLALADFRALQLGTWLQSPDGQLIAQAVEALSPPPLREDIELLVTGLTLAAKIQQNQGRGAAVIAGLAVSTAVVLLIAEARSA